MNYLITGGAGFIGSHIAEESVKDHNVTIIDNLSFGNINNLSKIKDKINFIQGDIRDINLLKDQFKDQDFILHQAALRSVPESLKNKEEYFDVNVNGTRNVLEAALKNKVKKVVFASTGSIYGDCKEPKKETDISNPISPYSESKVKAENLCKNQKGLKTVILRYFNVFGPKQEFNAKFSYVIPELLRSVMNNEQPIIFGDGNQSRDFIYIKDVVKANLKACEEDTEETINIASGKKTTINELLSEINRILVKDIKPIYRNPREGDIKHTLADISKQEHLLKINPKYSLETGLKETIDWIKKEL